MIFAHTAFLLCTAAEFISLPVFVNTQLWMDCAWSLMVTEQDGLAWEKVLLQQVQGRAEPNCSMATRMLKNAGWSKTKHAFQVSDQ